MAERQIITKLLEGGKHSVPELAKNLNLPPSTVEYHLQKFANVGIVGNTNPNSSGVRQYGKKYYLNPTYKPKTTWTLLLAALTFCLTLIGLTTFLSNPPNTTTLLLLFPSLIGVLSTFQRYRQSYINALNNILTKISKNSK